MFAIYTFGPQIVGLLGLGVGKNAALGNVVISLFFMLGCGPPMPWLNTAGRRPLLIGSFGYDTGAGGFGADPGYGDLAGSDGLCGVRLFWRAG